MAENFKALKVQKRGENILQISINRQNYRNALNRRANYELIRVLYEARHRADINVVVLTGEGATFCSATDLTEVQEYRDKIAYKRMQGAILIALVRAFVFCPKIIVAVVQGACIGLGFTLVSLCDIIFCTENAYFQAPFTKYGLCAEGATSYTLPKMIGRSKAMEMLLFGEKLTAEQALQYNFVAAVFKANELELNFWPHIERQAALPKNVLLITKRLICADERALLLEKFKEEMKELEHLNVSEYHFKSIEQFMANKSKL